ncbi:MAG: Fe-Mn family superoxide dismutase [SAR324 cluster bacterium]|jgi:Fe-Mn family superoxide dismutase|nr:Fe-Mn family superoxide dismutase [SAR324 cluster bacterium]MDP7137348.1 Fe-Mn family superoxide dismutase [SAR324 cluster bacterium]MDP7333130.1 Fe-Mn family superoxide dismutase [SAR324 cluster bacterium]HJL86887.1 Fe-Mn family superoxide dismutase [SAR324 cluster bacterium]HJO45398.1 Fe-Mn family superoxide dismutase [SAR324 cluster bacterium]|tara:strand:+ start:752 stop:1333 length:582 start_codon:yes stop_codon:yes gene_type:complete
MAFSLPPLPYEMNALEPHISVETLEFHYGKHHQTYINNLNGLVEGTENANRTLDEIIMNSQGGLFNNAAQVWNHTFYWNCMGPNGGGDPTGSVADAINKAFGSFADFKDQFSKSAATNFGSGWTWLVQNSNGDVEIQNTSNAGCPMTSSAKAILTIDVWEHAYYVDKRNARPAYIESWWNLVNWDYVNSQLEG